MTRKQVKAGHVLGDLYSNPGERMKETQARVVALEM